jgi:predicted HTH domain antitoxin
MKNRTINLPVEIDQEQEQDLKMAVAAVLFDKGVLSSGQAADYVGISKREFLENVGNYGVSIFGETPDDLSKEDL